VENHGVLWTMSSLWQPITRTTYANLAFEVDGLWTTMTPATLSTTLARCLLPTWLVKT
jgi:hypothetical protein